MEVRGPDVFPFLIAPRSTVGCLRKKSLICLQRKMTRLIDWRRRLQVNKQQIEVLYCWLHPGVWKHHTQHGRIYQT